MADVKRRSSSVRRRDWLGQVIWILSIALYLLLAIGLIVVSAITLRFGSSFFGTPGAASGVGGVGGEAGEAGDPVAIEEHRKLEQARSNVVSSIGIAIGVLALVLNSASLVVSIYFSHRWKTEAGAREFGRRKVWVLIVSTINGIFCACLIALAVGFGLVSHALAHYTTDLNSATPGYLIGACVMASLTAIAAAIAIYADLEKLGKWEAKLEGALDEAPPQNTQMAQSTTS